MYFFIYLSETKKIILILEQIQGEIKETRERGKTKGRMRGPSYTNRIKDKTPNTLKTKRNPINLQTFETQTPIQLSCRMFRGTPLKASVQEAHREE